MIRRSLACGVSLLLTVLWSAAEAEVPDFAHAADPEKGFTNSVGMKLAFIPAGKFRMGSPAGEKERDGDELEHEVVITRPFHMGVYEVTQGEFEKVMRYNPSF